MDIRVIPFGSMQDGRLINLYQLKNDHNICVEIINLGGIIVSVKTPDINGNIEDIVLGFDTLKEYMEPHPFFGGIIGRYANRIGNAKFSLEGKEYLLAANNGPNHLHGGTAGFDKKVWLGVRNLTTEFASVKMAYESPDGEENYPGNLLVEVEYVLNNQNELVINYSAKTDKTTHVNLTNHSYFNLSGQNIPVYDHMVQIDSGFVTEIDEYQIPTGNFIPVSNSAFDFTKPKKIGRDISQISPGYDHNYILNGEHGRLRKVAWVEDPLSGRQMEILTTEPGMQLYTGNFLNNIKGKGGNCYSNHSAFCMETQHYPDSPNKPGFPSTILQPGALYRQTTIYRFLVKR